MSWKINWRLPGAYAKLGEAVDRYMLRALAKESVVGRALSHAGSARLPDTMRALA